MCCMPWRAYTWTFRHQTDPIHYPTAAPERNTHTHSHSEYLFHNNNWQSLIRIFIVFMVILLSHSVPLSYAVSCTRRKNSFGRSKGDDMKMWLKPKTVFHSLSPTLAHCLFYVCMHTIKSDTWRYVCRHWLRFGIIIISCVWCVYV